MGNIICLYPWTVITYANNYFIRQDPTTNLDISFRSIFYRVSDQVAEDLLKALFVCKNYWKIIGEVIGYLMHTCLISQPVY